MSLLFCAGRSGACQVLLGIRTVSGSAPAVSLLDGSVCDGNAEGRLGVQRLVVSGGTMGSRGLIVLLGTSTGKSANELLADLIASVMGG